MRTLIPKRNLKCGDVVLYEGRLWWVSTAHFIDKHSRQLVNLSDWNNSVDIQTFTILDREKYRSSLSVAYDCGHDEDAFLKDVPAYKCKIVYDSVPY